MTQRESNASKGSKAVGSFCAHSFLPLHTFDNSVADLSLGLEPIEDEAFTSDHLCDFCGGLDFRTSPFDPAIFYTSPELDIQNIETVFLSFVSNQTQNEAVAESVTSEWSTSLPSLRLNLCFTDSAI